MANIIKKRGQKLVKQISRISQKAGEESKERIKENLVERLPHVKNVRLLIIEWSLLVMAIIMLAITQALWYAESYSNTTFVSGGTYIEATLGKINSLNPLFASTSSEKALSRLMFSTLSTTDYSGHIGPGLAETIIADKTGKVWTIKLRDNLKWSDGEPLTNADVLFTISLIQNSKVNSNYSSNLANVKVAEQEDGTITFTLPAVYVSFATALNIPILPEHILKDVTPELLLEHSFSSAPVTSGAFAYNATQAVGTSGEKIIYLTRNNHYYKGAPMLDSFAIHAFTSTDDIVSAFKNASITATAELSDLDKDRVSSSLIYEKQTAINNGVYLFFNTTNGAFKTKSLRKAVQRGLDLGKIRELVGDERHIDYPILSSQITLKNYASLPDYDPSAAMDTVTAAKLTEPIRLVTVSTGYMPKLAEQIKEQLGYIGMDVNVETYEPSQDFVMNVISTRSYDILLYEIELGPDPDLLAYYHSSQATSSGLNLSNYHNALADDHILAARSSMDANLRTAKYESFIKQWVEDAPAVGLYQVNMTYYFNKNVRSFSENNHLVSATDRFVDVEDWAAKKDERNRTP